MRLFTGLVDTLLEPDFHFALPPSGASTQLDGLGKGSVLNELVNPLVCHLQQTGNKCHVNQLVFGK